MGQQPATSRVLPPRADDFFQTLLGHMQKLYRLQGVPWRESDTAELADGILNMSQHVSESPNVVSMAVPIMQRGLARISSKRWCPPQVSVNCIKDLPPSDWCPACIAMDTLDRVKLQGAGGGL